ncbi:hypothetical protein CRUP_024633 [Coryphaenoides rupestris]|nr:hypothetical protein CRUP_024633 [Coryphaenoides rupestris]
MGRALCREQVSVDLDLSSVPGEDWGRYRCVFQLDGIEDIVTRLDPSVILSNWVKTGGTSYIIGVSVGVLLAAAAAAAVGVVLYRRRKDPDKLQKTASE